MAKKYKITSESKTISDDNENIVVYRIKAVRSFYNAAAKVHIQAGDYGGFIQNEDNLSQEGGCWIADDAMAFGAEARVIDDAYICDNALVKDNACAGGYCVMMDNSVAGDNAGVYEYAKLSDKAAVVDHGTVLGDAQISGGACVRGFAEVMENAAVSDSAEIKDYAKVSTFAIISDNAIVCGNAKVTGYSRVCDYACIKDNAVVMDNAVVRKQSSISGCAVIKDDARISGQARICGSACVGGYMRVEEEAHIKSGKLIGANKTGKRLETESFEHEAEKLAAEIDEFAEGFDWYDYHDQVEDKQQHINEIKSSIMNGKTKDIEKFLKSAAEQGEPKAKKLLKEIKDLNKKIITPVTKKRAR